MMAFAIREGQSGPEKSLATVDLSPHGEIEETEPRGEIEETDKADN